MQGTSSKPDKRLSTVRRVPGKANTTYLRSRLKDYTGVPFKHLGRSIEDGFDCVGIVVSFLCEFGAEIDVISDYKSRWYEENPDMLESALDESFEKVQGEAEILDVLSFSIDGLSIGHIGVVVETKPVRFLHTIRECSSAVSRLGSCLWRRSFRGVYRVA